ncbi:MAG: P-loop NTPase [Chloroflexi bacterium]|nr:P-loop NTPase [Chloroflexota bacterium]
MKRTKSGNLRGRDIEGSAIALESLVEFRKSIAEGNFATMVASLEKIFQNVGQEFLWAQLILFDDDGTVSFALMNPEEPESSSGLSIRELSTRLVGFKFPRESVVWSLCKDYPSQSIYFKQTNKRPSRSSESENHGKFIRYYDLFSINLEAIKSKEVIDDQIGKSRALPTFINTDKHPTMAPWLRNIIVTGSSWPSLGGLPGMNGVVLFPVKSGPGFERRGRGLKQTLYSQRRNIPFFSWLILYVAFVFQTYALSQATVDEPQRLRDYIGRAGWAEMLKETAQRRDINRLRELLKEIITTQRTIITRGILRDFFSLLEDLPREFALEVQKTYLEDCLSIDPVNEDLLKSSLLHLKTLYNAKDRNSDFYFLKETVWPTLKKIMNASSSEVQPYVYSALCDLIRVSSNDLLRTIAEYLLEIRKNGIQINAIDSRLLNALIIELMVIDDDILRQRLAQHFTDLTSKVVSGNSSPFLHELINRAYANFSPETQSQILKIVEDKGDFSTPTHKAFANILKRSMEIKTTQSFPFLFAPKGGVPGLKILTVVSHKGGVGKSLLAASIAALLSRNRKVALIDLDIIGPTMYHLIGNDGSRTQKRFLNTLFSELSDIKSDESPDLVREMLDRYAWKLANNNLIVFPCSPYREDQELIYPFMVSKSGLQALMYDLFTLCSNLYQQGYEFAIFDTPNELKDISLTAASLSRAYGGSILFVSTLYEPALQPFFDGMPIEYNHVSNMLFINKLRFFDKQYVANRQSFLDMLGSRYSIISNSFKNQFISEALIESIFNLDYCYPVGWNEQLERFLSSGQEISRQELTFEDLAILLEKDLGPAISTLQNR